MTAGETVPCGLCGKPTMMTGTRRCDGCWELEGRIQRNTALARRILAECDPTPGAPQQEASGDMAVEWTPGPNLFKDWCSRWFGPDSDDAYLARAVFDLPPMAQRFRAAATAPAGGVTDGAERWMAIVREKADDARKNAHGLRQFEGMEAEARARELAAQYLLETAHVMVLDERHAEALAGIVDQSGRIAELRATLTTAARAADGPPPPRSWASLLQQSRMNFETQFGHSEAADWIYRDLAELFDPPADATAARAAEPEDEEPSEKQRKLMELADRIDYERLCLRPGMFHRDMTPEQRDRMNAGIELRRYAQTWKANRWIVIPPVGPVRFSAATLDKAVEMAKADEARRGAASPTPPTGTEKKDAEPVVHQGMTIAGDGAAMLGRLMREQRASRLGVYPDGNPNAGTEKP